MSPATPDPADRGTPEIVGRDDFPPVLYIQWSNDPVKDEAGDTIAPERWVPESSRPYQEVFDAIDAKESESGSHGVSANTTTGDADAALVREALTYYVANYFVRERSRAALDRLAARLSEAEQDAADYAYHIRSAAKAEARLSGYEQALRAIHDMQYDYLSRVDYVVQVRAVARAALSGSTRPDDTRHEDRGAA